MIITRKSIARRTFLRGAGATLALPFLDAMTPALALPEQRAEVARRFSIIYSPNGMNMKDWTPTDTGTAYKLSPTLEPLAPYRDRMLVLSGLNNNEGDARQGEGETAPHERAGGVFLTGVHPLREGRTGISIDQIVASELGKRTQLASLELGLHTSDAVGNCEKGWSCAYISTLSWRTPTTPLPIEYRPRAVFERLFGDSTDPSIRMARIKKEKSILDAVTEATQRMQKSLGGGDRNRLTEYLEGVREVEHRIQMAEQQIGDNLPSMDPPTGIPTEFADHLKLMFDLQVLAYQTDMTRMITFMTGPEQSNRTYPEIGVRDVHHSLSHHRNDPVNLEKLSKINLYHSQLFTYYLDKLNNTPDVDGTLLDNMIIMYGCSMSDGNGHMLQNLPMLLLGGGSGQLKGGAHLKYEEGAPLANMYMTILDKLGIQADKFGDSNGMLNLLPLA